MPEEPAAPIPLRRTALAKKYSDGSFIVIVQTRDECSRAARDPILGTERLQIEGLIGDPGVWALAAQGNLALPLDVILNDPRGGEAMIMSPA